MHTLLSSIQAVSLWNCVVLALAASSISITLTQTELFVPLQKLADKCGHMIGYLFKCFYCMKHWVAIAGVAVYQPRIIVSQYIVIDYIVSIFFIVTLSSFISGLMFKVFINAMNKKLKQKQVQDTLK